MHSSADVPAAPGKEPADIPQSFWMRCKAGQQNETERGSKVFLRLRNSAKHSSFGGFASIFTENLPLPYKLP